MLAIRSLPIRARLTLWQVSAFAVIVGALVAGLVLTERATLLNNAQESLELTARVVVDEVSTGNSSLAQILNQGRIPGEVGNPEVIGQIVDGTRQVVDSSGPAVMRSVAAPAAVGAALRDGHWHGRLHLAGRDTGDMVFAVRVDTGPHAGEVVVLAQTLRVVDRSVRRTELLALAAGPVALALASLGGWLIAGRALRPVDELTRRAAQVDASAPHEPLPVAATDDEISRLAVTLNGMLERLSRALESERRIAADASHELRTPIGLMMAELDIALRSPEMHPDAAPVLESVRTEVAALGRIVSNLLLLSRAEGSGTVQLDRHPDDLLDIAYAVVGPLQRRAAELGLDLAVEGVPTAVLADPDLLRQAITNLVDNALRETGAGGRVLVEVSDGDGLARLAVTDTGPGIAPEDLSRIFDRFYRVDKARGSDRGGSGLGLEITRRIVEAHGGTIEVASELGVGSTFTITLPGGG